MSVSDAANARRLHTIRAGRLQMITALASGQIQTEPVPRRQALRSSVPGVLGYFFALSSEAEELIKWVHAQLTPDDRRRPLLRHVHESVR